MEKGSIIRVLVVDDSPLACKVLTDKLNSDPHIIVAGIVHNGKEAVEIVPYLKPDIITMDINMPVMDGQEAIKQIMAYNPTPILIISSSVHREGMDKAFKAIAYGALDVIDKIQIESEGRAKPGEDLIEKIKFLSGIRVLHHPLAKLETKRPTRPPMELSLKKMPDKIIAIASSTGGPQALLEILKNFPADFPCGIVIVQHIASGFVEGLVDWLSGKCHIKVKTPTDSEEIQPGIAYIAPSGLQMRVAEGKKIRLSDEPPYNGHKPSGNILLKSAAKVYETGAVGIILTGMGTDGAEGIALIKQMGGKTIAQDEKSCAVFGMPRAAIELNAVDEVLPLEAIAKEIARMLEES